MTIFASYTPTIDAAFLSAARRYWSSVFPFACREIRHWESHARTIPDPSLRSLALRALRQERGNLEGATAFATFTPPQHRPTVARAAVAFQAAYDYADAVSEQSSGVGNTRRLHQALAIAVSPTNSHVHYYACDKRHDDGGYLARIVDRCRASLARLPSFPLVVQGLRRVVTRIVTYQVFNHQEHPDAHRAFACWAEKETPQGADLRWWETAAAAGSSLAVFALMSAAGRPTLATDHASELESAYFPWIGSLHTLLDSLIDEQEDDVTGQHCLIGRYASREEAAGRLQLLTAQASRRALALSDGEDHMMILAAMASFYLSTPQARYPYARLATHRVLTTLGNHAVPAMRVLRAKDTMIGIARQVANVARRQHTGQS